MVRAPSSGSNTSASYASLADEDAFGDEPSELRDTEFGPEPLPEGEFPLPSPLPDETDRDAVEAVPYVAADVEPFDVEVGDDSGLTAATATAGAVVAEDLPSISGRMRWTSARARTIR